MAAQADALLRNRCAEAQTPLVLRLTAPELTRREQEVAFHTAAGLSNADIAQLLGRSVRTVEWHLQQVYAKLGVANRHELGAVLAPTTTPPMIERNRSRNPNAQQPGGE